MSKGVRFSVRDCVVSEDEARRYVESKIAQKLADIEDLRSEIAGLRNRPLPKKLPKYVENADGEWAMVTHWNPQRYEYKP
jgi:hypothetical protein